MQLDDDDEVSQTFPHIDDETDEADEDEVDIDVVLYDERVQCFKEIDDEMFIQTLTDAIKYLDDDEVEFVENDVAYFGLLDVGVYDEIDENEYQ